MADQASHSPGLSFSAYVETLIWSHPELEPLLHLLTGKYPPRGRCLTWSTSSKVDVIVVDIKPASAEPPSIERVRGIERLEKLAVRDLPNDIALGLFLVRDITAPVIELLSSVYESYPSVFETHMHTVRYRAHYDIDEHGCPLPARPITIASSHEGDVSSLTEPTGRAVVLLLSISRLFSGSSLSCALAAGLAAMILLCARTVKNPRRDWLRSYKGMEKALSNIGLSQVDNWIAVTTLFGNKDVIEAEPEDHDKKLEWVVDKLIEGVSK